MSDELIWRTIESFTQAANYSNERLNLSHERRINLTNDRIFYTSDELTPRASESFQSVTKPHTRKPHFLPQKLQTQKKQAQKNIICFSELAAIKL